MPFDDDDSEPLDRLMSTRRTSPGTTPTPIADQRVADRRQSRARTLLISVLVIAIMYFARPVIVPMALAVLFAFLLTPIVGVLERSFLRRTGAITLVLGLVVSSLGFGGWWIYQQFNAVAQEISAAAAGGHT